MIQYDTGKHKKKSRKVIINDEKYCAIQVNI